MHPESSEQDVAVPTPAPSSAKRWAWTGVRVVLGVGLLAVLVIVGGARETLQRLGSCRLEFLLAAVGLYSVGQALSALKWGLIAAFLQTPGRYANLLRYYFIGMFFNLFLPTIVGGDLYRMAALASDNRDRATSAAASVLLERLTGLYGLATVSLAGALVAGVAIWDVPLWVPMGLLVAAMVAAAVLLPKPGPLGRMVKLDRLVPRWSLGRAMRTLHVDVLRFRAGAGILVLTLGISLVFQLLTTMVILLVGQGMGLRTVPWWAYVTFVPIINLVTMAPVSINGLGVREAAYYFFFSRFGLDLPTCTSLSLLHLGTTLLASLIGGLLWLVLGSGVQLHPRGKPLVDTETPV